jgi:hypothetical protein
LVEQQRQAETLVDYVTVSPTLLRQVGPQVDKTSPVHQVVLWCQGKRYSYPNTIPEE